MLLKLLEALEKNVECHDCTLNDILYDYDEEICHMCQGDCDECKKESQEIIAKIRKEANEQTVEYINLDGLDSLKYKLVEKYNALFNKYEVTVFERGELNAITEILYMIDDIIEKQSLENKQATSDKTSETSSV